jgi:hypothetical protein
MMFRDFKFTGPLLAIAMATGLFACFPTRNDDGSPDPVLALSAIKTVNLSGSGDTTTYATYTYDANGMRVRERVDFMIFEWDSLGRYARWTQHDHRDTVETVTWVTPDSSARGSAGSSLITRERWFGLRPNCKCADSTYRYSFDGALLHVRRFSYDSEGNLTLVTRDWASPARRDTAQRYENHLADGRISWRIAYDHELEDTTRQVFVYAPLDSLIEAR